jgi:hypothetical protein
LPQFQTPQVDLAVLGLFLPVVLVLVAENVGHVKSVALMTDKDMNPLMGRALLADGVATMFAGSGGGSGTTTYAENIGVMAATKIYSTAVYWVAAGFALALSLIPKFGALINTIPAGVLGGAGTVLYGMIGLLGARIWVENKVNFSSPVNLLTAAVALVAGIANFSFEIGGAAFEGIAIGSIGAICLYHLMRALAKWRGTDHVEPASPTSLSGTYVADEFAETRSSGAVATKVKPASTKVAPAKRAPAKTAAARTSSTAKTTAATKSAAAKATSTTKSAAAKTKATAAKTTSAAKSAPAKATSAAKSTARTAAKTTAKKK